MPELERIIVDQAVLAGKPVVKGTRLAVEFLLGLMAQGWSETDILKNYPGLKHEDLLACVGHNKAKVGRLWFGCASGLQRTRESTESSESGPVAFS
jgi:uncharacterized protein (DUF433 family)